MEEELKAAVEERDKRFRFLIWLLREKCDGNK